MIWGIWFRLMPRFRPTRRFASLIPIVLIPIVLVAVIVATVLAAEGDLDTTFDGDGIVTTAFVDSALAYDVVIQADGKIVVAGETLADNDKFALARYNSDGSLDTTFDGDGRVTTDICEFHDGAHGVAIQADGKIVAAGTSCEKFALARYNSDGSLDTTFDGDGFVTTVLTGATAAALFDLAIQSDGKIVGVGLRCSGAGCLEEEGVIDAADIALARYNSNGSLDTTFGGDGIVTTDFVSGSSDGAHDVAIQADGKIVVAGGSDGKFALARYNVDGTLDTTFDGDGLVTTAPPGATDAMLSGLAIQSDGKIVGVGSICEGACTEIDHGVGKFALARYNSDGTLDTTFGGDGIVTAAIGDEAEGNAVAIQSDGKIVAVGIEFVGEAANFPLGNFALARFDASAITAGALSATSVTPASLVAGATGDVVVTFTTTDPVSAGRVAVTFPSGFVVTGAGVNAAGTNITGTLTLQGVSGQVVTIQGATIAADQVGASLTLTGVQNPAVTGSTGTFTVQTQDGSGTLIDENTSVAAVTITAGALSATSVTPASLEAGATGDVVVTFDTVNAVSAGRIAVTFPSGFVVTGAGVNAAGTNITGTLTLQSVSGQVVTIQGATISASQAGASFTLTGIQNPTITGSSGTFTLQTQDGSGTPVDEGTSVAAVTITAGALSATSVTPASLEASATGNVVVTFTTVNPVSDGRIAVTFPSGFDVASAGVDAAGTNITGTLTLQSVSGQVVTIQGATISASQAGASFTLTGIQNPAATGPTGTFSIETQDGSGIPIDEDTSVAAVSLIGGAITGGAVTLSDTAAGAQTAGTVAFTLANPVASGQSIVLTFPAGWTVFNGSMTATNWTGLDGVTPTSVTGDASARAVTIVLSAEQTTLSETLTIVASAELVNPTLAQTGLTLLLDASGQTQGTSSAFDITFAAASRLAVTTQPVPGDRQAGEASILTQPVVEIQDEFGNLVSNNTLTVTASLQAGTGAVGGTVAVAADAGVVTYTDLSIDSAGPNKVLRFTQGSLASPTVDSSAFTVSAATWSVATDGNDGNTCLASGAGSACLTINGAIGKAIHGDTISLAAGTYTEDAVVDKALTVQGVGATSIIEAASVHAVDIRSSSVTVDSLKVVSSTGSAIRLTTNIVHDGITISNNTLEAQGSQAVIWTCGTSVSCQETTDLTVTGNTITATAGGQGLLALGSSPPHSGWTVSDNTFASTSGVNLELRDLDSVTADNNTFTITAGDNVEIISELSSLTGPIVFSNNTLSGNTSGDLMALFRTASTTMDDVTITGNAFDAWDTQALRIGAGVSPVTVSLNSFLKTGDGVVALANQDSAAVDAKNNFWGKASGPGGTGVGDGGDIVESGTVAYRPWLLSDSGSSFTETIVLTVLGEWVLISAPRALDEVPIVVDDGGGTVSMLAYVNGAFVSPGAAFNADVVTPVSAFFVKATNLAAIGFRSGGITPPAQTAKQLTVGWNLVGTNFAGTPQNEFSSIQDTSQAAGMVTLHVPDTQNARKEAAFYSDAWNIAGNVDHDLNASPISELPTTLLAVYDGYWVFMTGVRTYSKQVQ